jgi:hypothetical protein
LVILVIGLSSVIAGLAVLYKISLPPELTSRQHKVGTATVRILVDTPSSQVADVSTQSSQTLGVQARVLSIIVVDDVVKKAIAARVGIRPDRLYAFAETSRAAPPAVAPTAYPQALVTRVVTNSGGDPLPIIELEARDTDGSRAAKLANVAAAELTRYLGTLAAAMKVPEAQRLRVSVLGAAEPVEVNWGPKTRTAVVTGAFVFLCGCVLSVLLSAFMRGWRAAATRDSSEGDLGRLFDVSPQDGPEATAGYERAVETVRRRAPMSSGEASSP